MKKLLLICLALLGSFLMFATQPICSVIKVNGGKHGYDYVHWETQMFGDHACWVGDCRNPGRERCIPPHNGVGGNSWNGDSTDETMIFILLDAQDEEWHDGEINGTITRVVQVEGEPELRIYRVVWSTLPTREVVVDVFRD
jgi:hypothetical protein